MEETTNGQRPRSRLRWVSRQVLWSDMKLDEASRSFRKAVIIEALFKCRGNLSHTAVLLGIHRNTLTRDLQAMPPEVRRAVRQFRQKSDRAASVAAAEYLLSLPL